MLSKKRINIFIIILVICALAVWVIKGNQTVEITEYSVKNEKIPESFDGYRIAHVSDLHNTKIGENNSKLVEKLKMTNCDIIVMTGDMIDSRNTDIEIAVEFVEKAVEIASVYYVTGNHEARIQEEYARFKDLIEKLGVTVLENKSVEVKKDGEKISITGIHDTGFDFMTSADYLVEEALDESDNYKILLAHRPEYFDLYNGVDLVFSGHAHGGQVRLPFIGGLFAPGQGIFPKYDAGVFNDNGKTMIVSRGIGKSLFPVRVNNNPEIVVVTLKRG